MSNASVRDTEFNNCEGKSSNDEKNQSDAISHRDGRRGVSNVTEIDNEIMNHNKQMEKYIK